MKVKPVKNGKDLAEYKKDRLNDLERVTGEADAFRAAAERDKNTLPEKIRKDAAKSITRDANPMRRGKYENIQSR